MARYGKYVQKKVRRVLHEYKRGHLHMGRSGKVVTSRKQAIAIGLSQAKRAGGKVPHSPHHRKRRLSSGSIVRWIG
ncbi:MAG: DUF6496 domain-containing protein [Candidatus Pacebacteria bacterium]|nr:DUF6496 domain-containing protein [Candidatus Paceibacterota bacterium]